MLEIGQDVICVDDAPITNRTSPSFGDLPPLEKGRHYRIKDISICPIDGVDSVHVKVDGIDHFWAATRFKAQ